MKEELIVNFIWLVILLLLIGAIAGEWKATSDTTSVTKETELNCQTPGKTVCDLLGEANRLNWFGENQTSIQWRRGFIGSCCLCIVLPVLANIKLDGRQILLVLVLTFLIFTSISGYNDYHMKKGISKSISDCLIEGIIKSPSGECSNELLLNQI